jgi:hypothetical membrane protein
VTHPPPTAERTRDPAGTPIGDLTAAAVLFGLLGVSWYVVGWFVAGWIRPGYDPWQQAISELFELGAPEPGRTLLVLGLVVSGVALVAFGLAMHRGLPGRGIAAPVVAALSGVMTVLVAVVPCTPGCPGLGASATDTGHVVVAGTGYVALMLAPLLAAWRVRAHDRALWWWSVLLGGGALLGFLVRNLAGVDVYAGLQQRVFNTLADLWYVVVGVWLLRRWPRWPGRGAAELDPAP